MSTVRFTVCIASSDWSYVTGQEVRVGSCFTADEIPEDDANAWLRSGIVERTTPDIERATKAPQRESSAIETATRAPQRKRGRKTAR